MPTVRLDEDAQVLLNNHNWSGNVRQLRNIAEQLSVLEEKRNPPSILNTYLTDVKISLPALVNERKEQNDFSNEREIMYKILFDMKKDLNDLKKITKHLNTDTQNLNTSEKSNLEKLFEIKASNEEVIDKKSSYEDEQIKQDKYHFAEEINEEETLSIHDKELELYKKLRKK